MPLLEATHAPQTCNDEHRTCNTHSPTPRGSILALCLTLSACGGEQFRNIGSLKTSVETFDPFEFTIGNFFIDARNGDFDAHVVTRAVDADGSMGEVLAVNQYILGSEGDFIVHLDAPRRGPSSRFHVGVYMNTDGTATWDPSEPAATIDGVPFEGTIDVTFTSSVLNTEPPFYHATCGMGTGTTDERHLAYKTTLDYDCRCSLPTVSPRTGKTYGWDFEALAQWSNMCGGTGEAGNGLTLGEGPQLKAIQGRMTNGDIWEDRNEIIFGVK